MEINQSNKTVSTPYFDWIADHTKLYEYNSKYSYSVGDQVTIHTAIYESLANNNIANDPRKSIKWHKIL